jgi:hypothetical protein
VPDALDVLAPATELPPDVGRPSDAEPAYRAGVHRARERFYQDWAAEFDRRVKDLLKTGMGPEQAGQRVMEEMGEFRRELRAELADPLLMEGAEYRRAAGE